MSISPSGEAAEAGRAGLIQDKIMTEVKGGGPWEVLADFLALLYIGLH